MARHRNVRNMRYEDELGADEYGTSYDDLNYAVSPATEEQFLYSKAQHTLSNFMEEPDIREESEEDSDEGNDDHLGDSLSDFKMPELDETNTAKLHSALEHLDGILGDYDKPTAVNALLRLNFDAEATLDEILTKAGRQTLSTDAPKTSAKRDSTQIPLTISLQFKHISNFTVSRQSFMSSNSEQIAKEFCISVFCHLIQSRPSSPENRACWKFLQNLWTSLIVGSTRKSKSSGTSNKNITPEWKTLVNMTKDVLSRICTSYPYKLEPLKRLLKIEDSYFSTSLTLKDLALAKYVEKELSLDEKQTHNGKFITQKNESKMSNASKSALKNLSSVVMAGDKIGCYFTEDKQFAKEKVVKKDTDAKTCCEVVDVHEKQASLKMEGLSKEVETINKPDGKRDEETDSGFGEEEPLSDGKEEETINKPDGKRVEETDSGFGEEEPLSDGKEEETINKPDGKRIEKTDSNNVTVEPFPGLDSLMSLPLNSLSNSPKRSSTRKPVNSSLDQTLAKEAGMEGKVLGVNKSKSSSLLALSSLMGPNLASLTSQPVGLHQKGSIKKKGLIQGSDITTRKIGLERSETKSAIPESALPLSLGSLSNLQRGSLANLAGNHNSAAKGSQINFSKTQSLGSMPLSLLANHKPLGLISKFPKQSVAKATIASKDVPNVKGTKALSLSELAMQNEACQARDGNNKVGLSMPSRFFESEVGRTNKAEPVKPSNLSVKKESLELNRHVENQACPGFNHKTKEFHSTILKPNLFETKLSDCLASKLSDCLIEEDKNRGESEKKISAESMKSILTNTHFELKTPSPLRPPPGFNLPSKSKLPPGLGLGSLSATLGIPAANNCPSLHVALKETGVSAGAALSRPKTNVDVNLKEPKSDASSLRKKPSPFGQVISTTYITKSKATVEKGADNFALPIEVDLSLWRKDDSERIVFFNFSTPSPDDIVRTKQERAFVNRLNKS